MKSVAVGCGPLTALLVRGTNCLFPRIFRLKYPSFLHNFIFLFSMIRTMKVAVIGGGPSGLVTLKYLITAHDFLAIEPIEAHLFESEAQIGGTFRYRTYEEAEVRQPHL
jgi:hypothetical protein